MIRTKLIMVRHGETDWNTKGMIQGHLDICLNDNGQKQALQIAEQLKNYKFSAIYSTDLKRGLETAQIINQYHNIEIKSDKRLRERNYGSWQGLTWEDVRFRNPELNDLIGAAPLEWSAPNGETMAQLFDRILSFLSEIKNKFQNSNPINNIQNDEYILIVSHNSPIRAIIAIIDGIPFEQYRNIKYIENTG